MYRKLCLTLGIIVRHLARSQVHDRDRRKLRRQPKAEPCFSFIENKTNASSAASKGTDTGRVLGSEYSIPIHITGSSNEDRKLDKTRQEQRFTASRLFADCTATALLKRSPHAHKSTAHLPSRSCTPLPHFQLSQQIQTPHP